MVSIKQEALLAGDAFSTRPAQVVVRGLPLREPVWVDLVSGRTYALPPERVTRTDDFTVFKDVPLYDAPVLIAEKSLVLGMRPPW